VSDGRYGNPLLQQLIGRRPLPYLRSRVWFTHLRDSRYASMNASEDAPAFEFTNGEPPVLLGHNEGANPVEFLLHALAGCVTTTTVLHATARGIEMPAGTRCRRARDAVTVER
jgi:hypothetical protein